ncbi:ADP-ribosylglycohydrolase family protein [Pseudobutyrivibrio sp.]|uniref:ADP-ribosylglycohydrolase family protein n=1 Tax=Pseudobutyrivibrio sp. TaxID=2014367 RepID=UPI0025DA9F85|nr:ADP-ribosylglycohydrolase family protein [Pseudobutyrivibrio sp.]
MRERTEIDISIMKKAIQQGVIKPKICRQCWTCEKYLEEGKVYCEEYAYGKLPEYIMFPKKECEKYEPLKKIDFVGCDEKLYGGILGFCVGDMLGVPVEFSSREERCTDPVKEMRAYGTYSQPFGTWSDDTSLSLCLIDAIGKDGDYKTIADNFIAYMDNGKFTPGDEMFDIGRTTQLSIEKMKLGVSPIECGMKSENDNGNGSLMRILPLAFVKEKKSVEQMSEYVKNISALTHGHIRSIIACEFYVEMAYSLYKGNGKEDAYRSAIKYITDKYSSSYPEEMQIYSRVLSEKVLECNANEIRSTGYVVDSLEASLWVFFKGNSYREVVLDAINLGGDTDTIGAIAGGLAGIYYGLSDIPTRWIQSIRKLDFIKEEIQNFEKKIKLI